MKIFLSAQADPRLKEYIAGFGCETCEVKTSGLVSEPVSCHPDIFYCALNSAAVSNLAKEGQMLSGNIYRGKASALKPKYPGDVLYNAAAVGKYLICSKYTSSELVKASGLIPVTVPQGYVKCNLVVVDESHVITEDRGIAGVLGKLEDVDCLLVEPGRVRLWGYDHGFIGGCSGRIGDVLIFNGDLRAHPDYKKIAAFVSGCGAMLKYFEDYPLTDIGSIIAPQTYSCPCCSL